MCLIVYPTFLKRPHDVQVRIGDNARLECAANGQPSPQLSWRKDGGARTRVPVSPHIRPHTGTDFPAAEERRMHVLPSEDVFYIVNVNTADAGTQTDIGGAQNMCRAGVYTCVAGNEAGTITASARLTVLQAPRMRAPLVNKTTTVGHTAVLECLVDGSPQPSIEWMKDGQLMHTSTLYVCTRMQCNAHIVHRHQLSNNNQLLVIVRATVDDSGEYACMAHNTLGNVTRRARIVVNTSRLYMHVCHLARCMYRFRRGTVRP
jgi:hypothetical protein